ncbi:DNA-binding beta-propeller fold protein YncE [Oxalobacteraceae bacterium GrIS 1.11]
MNHLKNALSAVVVAATFGAPAFAATPAVSGLITAPSRADIAYDTKNSVLFISGSDSIRRYDMKTQSYLSPIVLGGQTIGMDISPDGKTLAVANGRSNGSQNFVDLIDLASGKSSRIGFNLGFNEGGTFTVAYDHDSKLLVSSEFKGSGWTSLRKYNSSNGSTSNLGSVTQNTMLTASADHSAIAIAESNISNGPFGVYRTGDTSYHSQKSTDWFNYEIGISRDGSQLAVPTYGGTFVSNAHGAGTVIGEYAGRAPIGVAYSPVADQLFLPFANTNYIAEYNTRTGAQIGRITVPGTFDWTGNSAFGEGRTKVAGDGSYLFSTLDNGVFFERLAPVPEPTSWMMLAVGLFGLTAFSRKKTA